jgi:hypothetical protein
MYEVDISAIKWRMAISTFGEKLLRLSFFFLYVSNLLHIGQCFCSVIRQQVYFVLNIPYIAVLLLVGDIFQLYHNTIDLSLPLIINSSPSFSRPIQLQEGKVNPINQLAYLLIYQSIIHSLKTYFFFVLFLYHQSPIQHLGCSD